MILTIDGRDYSVTERIDHGSRDIVRQFRVQCIETAAAPDYYVEQRRSGYLHCDCPHSTCRLIGSRSMELCKHRRVLRAVGLIQSHLYPVDDTPDLFGDTDHGAKPSSPASPKCEYQLPADFEFDNA